MTTFGAITPTVLSVARARAWSAAAPLNTRSAQAPKYATEKCACVLLHRSDGDDDDVWEDSARGSGGGRHSRARHDGKCCTGGREDEVKSSRGTKYTGFAGTCVIDRLLSPLR